MIPPSQSGAEWQPYWMSANTIQCFLGLFYLTAASDARNTTSHLCRHSSILKTLWCYLRYSEFLTLPSASWYVAWYTVGSFNCFIITSFSDTGESPFWHLESQASGTAVDWINPPCICKNSRIDPPFDFHSLTLYYPIQSKLTPLKCVSNRIESNPNPIQSNPIQFNIQYNEKELPVERFELEPSRNSTITQAVNHFAMRA